MCLLILERSLNIVNKIQTGLLIFLLTWLLSGCIQQGKTYSNDENKNEPSAESMLWGKDTTSSIYIKPIDYAQNDPLGMQQQQVLNLNVGEMVSIPSGSFLMGGDTEDDEIPVHRVKIKAFKLGNYEVTQKAWYSLMGSNPSDEKNCDDCPVDRVDWNDIQNYLKKLNKKTGGRYRLPTEAEWEYACKSGGRFEDYCGGDNASSLAWIDDNSDRKSHPVGQKSPNGLGLYDMSGNVWEWVQDCWNSSYNGAPTNGSAWHTGKCERRVLRGGSWQYGAYGVRSANRVGYLKNSRGDYGFRIAHD